MNYFRAVESLGARTQLEMEVILHERLYPKIVEYQNKWKLNFEQAIQTVYRDFVSDPRLPRNQRKVGER